MVLCGVFTLIIVPALLPRTAPARTRRTLTLPRLAFWVERRRTGIRIAAAAVTLILGLSALNIRINPTLDRLRSVTPGARLLEQIGPRFGLPTEVYTILQRDSDLEPLLAANEQMADTISRALPSVRLQAASALLPAQRTQATRAGIVHQAGLAPAGVAAALQSAAADEGFRRDSFAPFIERLPRLLAPDERLTFDGYVRHGLGDLIGRFVAVADGEWMAVSYAFPSTPDEVAGLEAVVAGAGGSATLTGLPLVNRELAARFMPQFLKGLAIGTAIVLILMLAALRDWRLALLALLPAVLGLVWAAGLLALARIELDLFAVFAVVTFVGIGVDYGIHLVHRYRERGGARHAVEELAPVILVAAAITFLGYGTLVTSSYPPLRSIGIVSLVTVVTLAAASLLVLPAVLPPAGGRTAGGRPAPAARQDGQETSP
jgi:predicted exporter